MNQDELKRVLTDRNLAQLGDAILNFALSAALTRSTGTPTGRRVRNEPLTSLIDSSPLKRLLPARTTRRDRANSFEALAGYLWLKGSVKTENLIEVMQKAIDPLLQDSGKEQLAVQAAFKMLADNLENS